MVDIEIELREFSLPSIEQYRLLLSSSAVQQHLPLAHQGHYSDDWIVGWIASKQSNWPNQELGPWSVWVNQEFAGWCGVEPDGQALSYGIVLLQEHWGSGFEITRFALGRVAELFRDYQSVQIELPLSRRSELYAERLGLVPDGKIEIAGIEFLKYQLSLADFR